MGHKRVEINEIRRPGFHGGYKAFIINPTPRPILLRPSLLGYRPPYVGSYQQLTAVPGSSHLGLPQFIGSYAGINHLSGYHYPQSQYDQTDHSFSHGKI